MSRAFINEDNHVETPFVPPRAHLPRGITNYVTPAGLEALLDERDELQKRLKELNEGEEIGKLSAINAIHIKLDRLENRIITANVVEKDEQDMSEVRFGSEVLLQIGKSKKTRKLQIVGVDEADMKKGKLSFISPLAKAMMNKKVGEEVVLKLERGQSVFKVLEIS